MRTLPGRSLNEYTQTFHRPCHWSRYSATGNARSPKVDRITGKRDLNSSTGYYTGHGHSQTGFELTFIACIITVQRVPDDGDDLCICLCSCSATANIRVVILIATFQPGTVD